MASLLTGFNNHTDSLLLIAHTVSHLCVQAHTNKSITHTLTTGAEVLLEAAESLLSLFLFGLRNVCAHTGHMRTYLDTRYRGSKAYTPRIWESETMY